MRRPSRTSLSWMFALSATIPAIAQNIESIGREKPMSLSGGVSINQIFFASRGTASTRNPYTYFASANLNMSIYGWTVPLAFSVSNTNSTFTQPFNQYSMSPTWKWITLHVGCISMSLSPYTVNGHLFSGTAIDLTPTGKWKVSALYGRFLKAVEINLDESSQPSFQRMGYALKATYGADGKDVELILFHAEDDKYSITQPPDSVQITPQENFVVSLKGTRTILKRIVLKSEMAASAITKDTRAAEISSSNVLAKSDLFFQPRLSSSYYRAIQTSLDYQGNGWTLGTGYERIDPEYRTLGAYYFNNDLENITIRSSAQLIQDKLDITLTAGVQHDNLDNTKVSTMRRMVSSLNFTLTPSPKLNLSGSWSSFQTYTHIRSPFEKINVLTPYENLDTLDFTQISRTGSLMGVFALDGTEKKKQRLNLNFTWQQAADSQNSQYASTRFCNLNAGYSLSFIPTNTNLALTLNAVIHDSPAITTHTIGPTASITRAFFGQKLRASLSTSIISIYNNGENINRLINGRFNGTLSIHKKHRINMSAVLIRRHSTNSVTEFTLSLGYHYSFGDRKH